MNASDMIRKARVYPFAMFGVLTLSFLSGCGGGGGGSGGEETSPSEPVTVTASPSQPSSDTRIGKEDIVSPTLMETFRQHDVSIALTEQELARESVYVKIETTNGEMLFLGRIEQPVDGNVAIISLHIPVATYELRYQVFGDDGLLETRLGSMML